ncbi:MAG TPA: phosphopantetheine-binding protein [Acidimicrobiales bacterium]|nr:phosphopantetheine-binding protein [Acidimicrobiales bacterium]
MTLEAIRLRMAEVLEVPEGRVNLDAVLTDLVSDSFRLVEMAIELQEHFDVMFGQEDMKNLRTVGDMAELVRSRLSADEATGR